MQEELSELLVELFKDLEGNRWRSNLNWLTYRELGDWAGITTDGEGRVVEEGTPDELVRTGGRYSEMLQQGTGGSGAGGSDMATVSSSNARADS